MTKLKENIEENDQIADELRPTPLEHAIVEDKAVESLTSRAIAVIRPPAEVFVTDDSTAWEVAEQVTRPVLTQQDNTSVFVQFDGAIHRAEERRGDKPVEDEKKLPPMIASVTNLQTGELQTLVCGAVLHGELSDKYPGDGYIGKAFRLESQLVAMKGKSGQRMRVYDIKELRRKV